ncbi:hypothetical protein Skr01_75890 [Sphaerisporangium krabiense]|uniref:Uncharacterized protein n=1 Tax=Sphaerisporangium krabiense TaxID=763782 RepID=A0A7W8ZAA0_9ACTN|nr:hypothetical protein [Sphaerisporangium krabiense]MBB5630210.1 hypothetical protein [Sphaerisporangium krabiense]GII67504.1 hypothetical protein Skr01_75890 [Sphaerisporangium krabiense]
MTGIDRPRPRSENPPPSRARQGPQAAKEQQYRHLVRLGWELNKRGVRAVVDLPSKGEPVLMVPREPGVLRIMAFAHKGAWLYTWGRGRAQRVPVVADDAAERIWEVAR